MGGRRLSRATLRGDSRHPWRRLVHRCGTGGQSGDPSGPAETTRVVNTMRRPGVLVGTTGRNGDVLKIRPPLMFELQHADLLLNALDQTLQTKT